MILRSWDLRVPQRIIKMGSSGDNKGALPCLSHSGQQREQEQQKPHQNPSFIDWVHCARLHPQASLIWIDGVLQQFPGFLFSC